jgi:hypothetical protein
MSFIRSTRGIFLLVILFNLTALAQPVLTNDLVAFYPLDGDAEDQSGNQLSGIVVGASSAIDRFGKTNSAMSFDGASSYIDCGNPAEFNFASNFTLTAWIKLEVPQLSGTVLGKFFDAGSGIRAINSYALGIQGDQMASASMVRTNPDLISITGDSSLNDGKWHALAMVYSSGFGLKLFTDGNLISSIPVPGLAGWTNSISCTIGKSGSGDYFKGSIDDIRIFKRDLSDDDIHEWFALTANNSVLPFPSNGLVAYYPLDGTATDFSPYQLNGLIVGTTTTSDRFGFQNRALSFNGSTDYIDLGNPAQFNFKSNFTLTAWVQLKNSPFNSYIIAKYFDSGSGALTKNSYGLAVDDELASYAFVLGTGPAYQEARGSVKINDNGWHALTMVYDSSNGIKLYTDAKPTGSAIARNLGPFTNSIHLIIGKATSGQYFSGSIDEVRIYDRALPPSEIAELFAYDTALGMSISRAVRLDLGTIPGIEYSIESSSDLIIWTPVGDPFTATNSVTIRYVDAEDSDQYFRYSAAP